MEHPVAGRRPSDHVRGVAVPGLSDIGSFRFSSAWFAGALATLGQTREVLDTLANDRSRHPEDRIAADLERAIRVDAARQTS